MISSRDAMRKIAEEAVKMRKLLKPIPRDEPLVFPRGSPEYKKARKAFDRANKGVKSNYGKYTDGTLYY